MVFSPFPLPEVVILTGAYGVGPCRVKMFLCTLGGLGALNIDVRVCYLHFARAVTGRVDLSTAAFVWH